MSSDQPRLAPPSVRPAATVVPTSSGRTYRLSYSSPLSPIVGRNGVTLLGFCLAMFGGGAVGAAYNLAGAHHLLARAFDVAFAVPVLLAYLVTRRDALRPALVAIPLGYAVIVVAGSVFTMTGSGLKNLVAEAAVQALYSAPGLFAAVGGAVVIWVVRVLAARSSANRRKARERAARLRIPG